jgi:hypothetical protein
VAKVKNIDHWKLQLQMYEQMPDNVKALNGWSQEELEHEIADLKQKIEQSQRGKSSRRKGASYENTIAKVIGEKWGIRLVRTPMSGGFQKSSDNEDIRGDLSCLDKNTYFKLHPECKKQKTWKLRDWFKQADSDCPKGKIPIVIFHEFQKNVEGKREVEAEDFVQIRLSDFLEIVDESKIIIKKAGMKRDGNKSLNGRNGTGSKKARPKIRKQDN